MVKYPNTVNNGEFMVFTHELLLENLLFRGNINDFSKKFFKTNFWQPIVDWAKENDYVLVVDGSTQYYKLVSLLDSQDTKWYDSYGKISASGCYDISGHMDMLRVVELAEYLEDR